MYSNATVSTLKYMHSTTYINSNVIFPKKKISILFDVVFDIVVVSYLFSTKFEASFCTTHHFCNIFFFFEKSC